MEPTPTPEKRLSLEEWQDKISIEFYNKPFDTMVFSSTRNEVLLKALQAYHAHEVSFLQSQIPQWVSVDERLPEQDTPVLVWQNQAQILPCFKQLVLAHDGSMWREFASEGQELYAEGEYKHVAYWMPLPQPPTN